MKILMAEYHPWDCRIQVGAHKYARFFFAMGIRCSGSPIFSTLTVSYAVGTTTGRIWNCGGKGAEPVARAENPHAYCLVAVCEGALVGKPMGGCTFHALHHPVCNEDA